MNIFITSDSQVNIKGHEHSSSVDCTKELALKIKNKITPFISLFFDCSGKKQKYIEELLLSCYI